MVILVVLDKDVVENENPEEEEEEEAANGEDELKFWEELEEKAFWNGVVGADNEDDPNKFEVETEEDAPKGLDPNKAEPALPEDVDVPNRGS